ncbi:PTS sugar transporter subunit IIB [[Lactobacillus] timonensis]|uniref:PTS maltose transporter subunit IIABC n=1 Tax=[Lactobacillus] timonensis TaxID=1970790 RepID=UPI000C821FC5|nr:PTS maltose transporter subunit IIABC [[Lactobacillus] timonensis]
MKIVAICGLGVGSSVIGKMNIDSIVSDNGFDDVDVDTVDLGSVSGKTAEIYVTTRELFDNLPEDIKPKTIVLTNFVDKADIEKHLVPKIKEIQGQ